MNPVLHGSPASSNTIFLCCRTRLICNVVFFFNKHTSLLHFCSELKYQTFIDSPMAFSSYKIVFLHLWRITELFTFTPLPSNKVITSKLERVSSPPLPSNKVITSKLERVSSQTPLCQLRCFNDYTRLLHVSAPTGHLQVVFKRT